MKQLVLTLAAALLFCGAGGASAAEMACGERGMVASVHPLATQAGVEVLRSGGNAVDAAVAVGLTLGVVDTHNSGIGGGCFLLIRLKNGKVAAIDGRETAPGAATRDMYIRDGRADARLSQTGALASGVPGELAAFDCAVREFGTKPLAALLLPAADLAEKGFVVSPVYASRLKSVGEDLGRFESSRAIFFKDGRPLRAGELLRQADLAATYRSVARQGVGWFYRGPFAQATERWMRENEGILTAGDFAKYRVVARQPVETTYRGYRVVSFPPPGSGGVHLAQMLNILERFDLKSMDEPTRLHVLAETMKVAFADRAYWLGDPEFTKVPRGLVSKKYAASLAKLVRLDHTSVVAGHGLPPQWESAWFDKHTTHFSVADAEGNWVACTATINTTFGSKVVIPGTGVMMNNQMDDFSIQPGVTNYFGLAGGEANAIAPGKRPLSSMTPTLVFKGRQPVMALGAAGGPKIITTVLQELVAMIDLGKDPAEALAEPRVHHQWSPDQLFVEDTLPASVRAALEKLGHHLEVQKALSTSQIVARARNGSGFVGAADPRVSGSAAGW